MQATHSNKPIRRQYHSCDQCRRGRRACDAASLAPSVSGNIDVYPVTCSTCAKTGKRCTFDWLQAVSKKAIRCNSRRSDTAARISKARKAFERPADHVFNDTLSDDRCSPPSNSQLFLPSRSYRSPQGNIHTAVRRQDMTTGASASLHGMSQRDSHNLRIDSVDWGFQRPLPDSVAMGSQNQSSLRSDTRLGCSEGFQDSVAYPLPMSDLLSSCSVAAESDHIYGSWTATTEPCSVGGEPANFSLPPSGRHYSSPSSDEEAFNRSTEFPVLPDPSPTGLQSRLAASSSRGFIATGLIRIYHDSLEHSLSCWVTESTCPYNIETSSLSIADRAEPIRNELGSEWSNRMCVRVCLLDTAFDSIRKHPLSVSDNRAASKALNLAVMAFASQWSHLRSSEDIADTYPGQKPDAWPLISDFDRMIQEHFWHEAHRALQNTADISSFRAIFAHMVFALAQRPMKVAERNAKMAGLAQGASPSTASGLIGRLTDFDTADCNDLTELESPSHLETALRHLFLWRRRLETINIAKATQKSTSTCKGATLIPVNCIGTASQRSFNILFWLGVMCDTTSAAINNRPLVISDEDSAIIRSYTEYPSKGMAQARQGTRPYDDLLPDNVSNTQFETSQLWRKYLLQVKNREPIRSTIRWPCSYEDAAEYLCEAIPVKVLLFRKVTCLQTLSYRRAAHEDVEQCIEDALSTHQYWESTYGQFILDCVADHNNLPPRIQSWYIILAGHWHLAGLLLADVIELLDEHGGTMDFRRTDRQYLCTVTNLRKINAYAIANLARVSCSPYATSFARAHEFHCAVREGALLTEPWTDILMLSFVKAGNVFLSWLSVFGELTAEYTGASQHEVDDLRDQLLMCVQALELLGRKSDSAFLAAKKLRSCLRDLDKLHEPFTFRGEHRIDDRHFVHGASNARATHESGPDFEDCFQSLQTAAEFDNCLLQIESWRS
jgi:Fungal Zn(2)-Cys(6) binuclear cluster domain